MQHAAALAVPGEFLLEGPKDFGLRRLELETHLVGDAAAALDVVAALSLQTIGDQPPPLGQRMVGRGGDFGQRDAAVAPRDHVARAGDVDLGLVVAALDHARVADLEQFRVQWSAVELENQFRDFRSNGEHGGGFLLVSSEPRTGATVFKSLDFIISIFRAAREGRSWQKSRREKNGLDIQGARRSAARCSRAVRHRHAGNATVNGCACGGNDAEQRIMPSGPRECCSRHGCPRRCRIRGRRREWRRRSRPENGTGS